MGLFALTPFFLLFLNGLLKYMCAPLISLPHAVPISPQQLHMVDGLAFFLFSPLWNISAQDVYFYFFQFVRSPK